MKLEDLLINTDKASSEITEVEYHEPTVPEDIDSGVELGEDTLKKLDENTMKLILNYKKEHEKLREKVNKLEKINKKDWMDKFQFWFSVFALIISIISFALNFVI